MEQVPKTRAKIKHFQDLHCWQKACVFTKTAYQLEGKLAKDWDTRSQFRRAALSIMNNIAEGFCRFSNKEFIRFLEIAQSSAAECKSMLHLFEELEYLPKKELQSLHEQVDETRNLILGLIKYLHRSSRK